MQLEIPMAVRAIRSVSEITNLLQRLIEQQPQFRNVWVQGQISNYSRSGAGHIYFTLKDTHNQISCALFRQEASRLRFLPRDGDEILVQGHVGIYPVRSEYQIKVNKVEPLGVGALQRAFEELKRQLAAEGLFDADHKKPLPKFPKKIGVVTSATGAAFQDICQQLRKRYPLAEVLLHPTLVQGEGAAEGIAAALAKMNQREDIEVLIVGRGGGSIEDLWAFNEERVARAIFASTIPIVSAVGHETDVTIADMVADHRAPTPSAAVEHIVPDQEELSAQLDSCTARLRRITTDRLEVHKTRLQELKTRLAPTRRKDTIYQLHQNVDTLDAACRTAIERGLRDSKRGLHTLVQRLNILSPLATLERGYSISRKTDGAVLTSAEQVSIGDSIEIQLSHGHLACRVEELRSADLSEQSLNRDPLPNGNKI